MDTYTANLRFLAGEKNTVIDGTVLLFKDAGQQSQQSEYVSMASIGQHGECRLLKLEREVDYFCILPYQIKKSIQGNISSDTFYYGHKVGLKLTNQDDPKFSEMMQEIKLEVVIDASILNLGTLGMPHQPSTTIPIVVGNHVQITVDPGNAIVDDWTLDSPSDWVSSENDKTTFSRQATSLGENEFRAVLKINPQKIDIDIGRITAKNLGVKPPDLSNLNHGNINPLAIAFGARFKVEASPSSKVQGDIAVTHRRSFAPVTEPMSFFAHLLNASKSIEFGAYRDFIDRVFCSSGKNFDGLNDREKKVNHLQSKLADFGVGGYELLKTATEAFLLMRGCITENRKLHEDLELGDYAKIDDEIWGNFFNGYLVDGKRLPYINWIIKNVLPGYRVPEESKDPRFCTDILIRSRVNNPCFLELIWNYWHEEGMLVQTINAVSRRFQNLRAPGDRDPLAHVEIDPLRPLNNIFWGYVEEERDRLSIKRRAYEYQHQYGLQLYGKAVANMRPADNRSKYLEAFHNLLSKCAEYFRAKQDTTVDPDGYPMLHAIQELNLILAHGAHNQFGDLAWTSRVEMLMQQWILARPEMRDFLQSRAMVPHKEAWMPQVDTMKSLQGWTDVAVTHFRDLGVLGEQILLTIRWHNWHNVTNEDEAKGWADLMRPYIQSYIHAYRAVTGVDLSLKDNVDYTMPSVLLRKRLAAQHASR